ncbi:MAG: hypothetical protein AAF600_13225 [Bacteroidota bacterium]
MSKIHYLLLSTMPLFGVAQETQDDFRNFPIVVTIQFQSFSLPFQNLKGHFRNFGIGIGTEVSYNSDHNWVQHLDLMWFRNKAMGNGLVLSTQSGWRPYISNPLYSEIKLGFAYFYSFRPEDSFQQMNGEWVKVGKRGKGIFAIPAGITLGSHDYREDSYTSPFLGYQIMLTSNYAKSLPVTPWSFIQIGTSVHSD